MCSNLAFEKVIGVARIYNNGDGLMFKESSNFHLLWVGVTGQHMHYIVGRLGLFLFGFIFKFEVIFKWYGNASIDIDGIMAMGVMWMPFSCSLLRSWVVDLWSSSRKTFSIMVHTLVKSWK
ncbi:hypothetical protein B296_00020454 [Ensete ventricosum]|uniref:Transmembrane protein n=1 Tax=Ensete ventricosum TaxID=4639 RepID=A0A426X7E3_ENSVE|nr:hypothetical protein B296_00020454 [Ensete ventricosum]